jgi:hypothetical protein
MTDPAAPDRRVRPEAAAPPAREPAPPGGSANVQNHVWFALAVASPIVQCRARHGTTGDSLESEADLAASHVLARLTGAGGSVPTPRITEAGTRVQRQGVLSQPASPAAAPAFLVDDAAVPGPDQMRRADFLAAARAAVCAAIDPVLGAAGSSSDNCPYLERVFRQLEGRDAAAIGRMLSGYMPEGGTASTPHDVLAAVAARAHAAAQRWSRTGELPTLPAAMSAGLLSPGSTDALAPALSLQRKAEPGAEPTAADPAAIRDSLGPGAPLDTGISGRMGSAFGADFSHVRIHHDGAAAALARGLDARAFTVGEHVAFGAGEYRPRSLAGDALIAHELAHVLQQTGRGPGGLRLQRCSTPDYAPTSEIAHKLSNEELYQQIRALRRALEQLPPGSAEAVSMEAYVSQLEDELLRREPGELIREEGEYPREIALMTSYFIRGGYIRDVAQVVPAAWRTMSEAELTAHLSNRFTLAELESRFLSTYEQRNAIKARYRKASVITALVIGLIWARENLAEGEWGIAAAKVGGMGVAAWAFNRVLYARDPAAQSIMASKAGAFGRWFQGAARSNRAVNFLVRRVGGALLLWEVKDVLMSGGGGGPNIPFDLIVEIDLDDPSTWVEPDQTLLDLGFNIWYRQKRVPDRPETFGDNYLGRVEGSAIMGVLKLMDIAPHTRESLRGRVYRVEGTWDDMDFIILSIAGRRITAADNVLVVGTGQRSGSMTGGRGHYRKLEVIPASSEAVELMEGPRPQWVPDYLLVPVQVRELEGAGTP